MWKKHGFTLIELLVVVLIIGILSAAALPQYQKAVAKARTVRILPLLRGLAEAEERFYMANGYYAQAVEDLDISWPSEYLPDGQNVKWKITSEGVHAPFNYTVDMPEVSYYFLYGSTSHPVKGKFVCNGYDSSLKAEICRSLGKPVYAWTPYFTFW